MLLSSSCSGIQVVQDPASRKQEAEECRRERDGLLLGRKWL